VATATTVALDCSFDETPISECEHAPIANSEAIVPRNLSRGLNCVHIGIGEKLCLSYLRNNQFITVLLCA
jgi:hypothetical protein